MFSMLLAVYGGSIVEGIVFECRWAAGPTATVQNGRHACLRSRLATAGGGIDGRHRPFVPSVLCVGSRSRCLKCNTESRI
jgi:hypothetical protein